MGIFEALEGKGKTLLDHGRVPPEEKAATRLAQLTCDLFLTGTNAVTLDGCLVNLDMNGNRTNAMTFGPRKTAGGAGGRKRAPAGSGGASRWGCKGGAIYRLTAC